MNPFHFTGRLELLRLGMGDPAKHSARPCLEDPKVTARHLLAQGSAPKRHRKTTIISDHVWDQRFRRLREPLGSGKVLALLGPRFCGKTQLAVELMRDYARFGRKVLYRTAGEFFHLFKGTVHEQAEASARSLNVEHRRVAFLVIDEINHPSMSDWQRLPLFEIVNRRHDHRQDTLLVSTLPPEQFAAAIGDAISSRIQKADVLVVLRPPPPRDQYRERRPQISFSLCTSYTDERHPWSKMDACLHPIHPAPPPRLQSPFPHSPSSQL